MALECYSGLEVAITRGELLATLSPGTIPGIRQSSTSAGIVEYTYLWTLYISATEDTTAAGISPPQFARQVALTYFLGTVLAAIDRDASVPSSRSRSPFCSRIGPSAGRDRSWGDMCRC